MDIEYTQFPDTNLFPFFPSLSPSNGLHSSNVSLPSQSVQTAPAAFEGLLEGESYTLDSIDTFALSPVVSSSGLKGILLDVIGPYDNIITQYRYQSNTSSNYSYVHETTPDYPWIASACLFIVLVYSVFSLLRRALWMK